MVAVSDVPSPKSPTIVVQKGMNLRTIAKNAYGHERFSGFIASLNGVADPELIVVGQTLKLPSLSAAFSAAGLDSQYQPALNAIAKACTDYYAVEPAYLEARRASGVSEGRFNIPKDIQTKLQACADAVEAGAEMLRSVKPGHAPPKMTIDQFLGVAAETRGLASGLIDGYGYDYDMVGQRFGLGFTNAIVWTLNKQQ